MSDTSFTARSGQDARLAGMPLASAPAEQISVHYFDFLFDCKFEGLDFYAWDSNPGDTLTLETEYYAGETYGWIRYKKFGKAWNIFPNEKLRIILFPTEPILGVRAKFSYDNKGTQPVKFAANMFQFIDHKTVNPAILGEGEDW